MARICGASQSKYAKALSRICCAARTSITLNDHYEVDGAIIYKHACALGCEGIVSKRLGSPYRSGRADCWIKIKNPDAPAAKRIDEEDWSK